MAAKDGFDIIGTLRSMHGIPMTDMYHDPNLAMIVTEFLEDSVAHGATGGALSLRKSSDGNYTFVYCDNGDGDSDSSRILQPAKRCGKGTSMYGSGHRLARLKADVFPATREFKIIFKKKGDTYSSGFLGPWTKSGLKSKNWNLTDPDSPFKTAEESGYYEEFPIHPSRFPKMFSDPANVFEAFRSDVKEIICTRFPQKNLNRIALQVSTTDSDGTTKSDDSTIETPWRSFVDVLQTSEDVVRYDGHEFTTKECKSVVRYFQMKKNNKDIALAKFKNYGRATKGGTSPGVILWCLDDRVVQVMPMERVYGSGRFRIEHSGCVVVVNMTPLVGGWDITKTPKPTTVKNQFQDDDLFKEIQKTLRDKKPAKFASDKQEDASPVAAAPAPAAGGEGGAAAPVAAVSDPTVSVQELCGFEKILGVGYLKASIVAGVNTIIYDKPRLAPNVTPAVAASIAMVALNLCSTRNWNEDTVRIIWKLPASRQDAANAEFAKLAEKGLRIATHMNVERK